MFAWVLLRVALDAGVHPAGAEHAFGIEAFLDAPGQRCQRGLLRLEHRRRSADWGRRADQRGRGGGGVLGAAPGAGGGGGGGGAGRGGGGPPPPPARRRRGGGGGPAHAT